MEQPPRFIQSVGKDVVPLLIAVTEAAEREKLFESAGGEFCPSHTLEVAGSHPQQLTLCMKLVNQFSDGWAQLRTKIGSVALDFFGDHCHQPREFEIGRAH